MSDVGEMVADLIEAGCSPEVAAEVVARAFAAGISASGFRGIPVDSATEKRRAYDRERKRKSAEIRRNSTGVPDVSLSIEKKEERKKEKRESAKASQLPSGWRPSPETWAEAVMLLGSEERAELELKKFTNHASEKGRLAKNWNSAWANWAIKAVEYGGRNGHVTNGHRTTAAAGPAATGADAILAGMGRIADRIAARKLAERQDGLDLAGQPDPERGRS